MSFSIVSQCPSRQEILDLVQKLNEVQNAAGNEPPAEGAGPSFGLSISHHSTELGWHALPITVTLLRCPNPTAYAVQFWCSWQQLRRTVECRVVCSPEWQWGVLYYAG